MKCETCDRKLMKHEEPCKECNECVWEWMMKEYCDKCGFEITELDERHLIDRSGKCNPNMYDSPIILCQNCCKYEESK
jgi:hypothetical protein